MVRPCRVRTEPDASRPQAGSFAGRPGSRARHDGARDGPRRRHGHAGHGPRHAQPFLDRLVFTVPIFVYRADGPGLRPLTPPFGLELRTWLFFLASAAILYPGWPFFVAAWRALRNGVLNMAALVVLSVGTGYLFSVGATFFFEGAAVLRSRGRPAGVHPARPLAGDARPCRRVGRHQGADGSHAAQGHRASATAWRVEVPTAEVLAGEIVVIRPGNKIPVDGDGAPKANRRSTSRCSPASRCR